MILTEEDKSSLMDLYLNMDYSGWDLIDCTEKIVLDKLQDKLKNAERYEWIRNTQRIGSVVCPESSVAQMWVDTEMLSEDFLDKAIDSAIAKERN